LKTLLVTSQVTFVPENYNRLIVGLAKCPQIGGLLVLKNWDSTLFLKSLGLMLIGAKSVGKQLLRNKFSQSTADREKAFVDEGKPVWYLDTVNCTDAIDIVEQNGFDLLLNARTRFIYKKEILQAPKMGCINIHHGLLPDQRGTFCDLWALYNGVDAGFSVHQMSEKIDDGSIVSVTKVTPPKENDFLQYLLHGSEMELKEVSMLLENVEVTGAFSVTENTQVRSSPHYRNPTRTEIRLMRKRGMKI